MRKAYVKIAALVFGALAVISGAAISAAIADCPPNCANNRADNGDGK